METSMLVLKAEEGTRWVSASDCPTKHANLTRSVERKPYPGSRKMHYRRDVTECPDCGHRAVGAWGRGAGPVSKVQKAEPEHDTTFYHVTPTHRAAKVVASGITPGKKPQWHNTFGANLGSRKHIYAFTNKHHAVLWAAKQAWDSKKPTSIVEFKGKHSEWERDPNPLLRNTAMMRAGHVAPEHIMGHWPVGLEHTRAAVQYEREQGGESYKSLVLKAQPQAQPTIPKVPEGQSIVPPTPRIIRRPSDLEEKRGWGDEKWMQWKDKGSTLTGRILKPKDLPDTLHHVTSDMPGVQSSGMLQGKHDGGGFGGGQAEGVSFTADRAMAEHLHREMLRMGQVSRGEVPVHHFDKFAREDEHIHGLTPGSMQHAVEFAQRGHDANRQSPVYDSPAKLRSLAKDSYNSYLIARDSVMRQQGMPSKNPMFFTDAETAAKWTPDKVGIVSVPKHAIPHEALTTSGSDDWLNEVRAYSDVPTHQGQFWPEPKEPDPAKQPWQHSLEEYAPYPHGAAGQPDSTVFSDYLKRKGDWQRGVKAALSEGRLQPQQATSQGFNDSQMLDKLQPMPDTLYHVTTNKTKALQQGLKSRAEQGGGLGAGLGGGEDDTISLTDNPDTAKRIHDALHEARDLLRGDIKPEDLLHQAAMGHGADRPWIDAMMRGGHGNVAPGEKDAESIAGEDWKSKLPPGWQAYLQGKTIQHGSWQKDVKTAGLGGAMNVKDIQAKGYEPTGHTWRGGDGELKAMHYHRPMTDDETLESRMALYKLWSAHREHAGGPEDPLFFLSDPKKLATTPKEDIGILKVHPHPGSRGVRQNALGEWRTYSGKALRVEGGKQPKTKKSEDDLMRPILVLKADQPVRVQAYVRQGHMVQAYTQQREHGLLTVAEVAHPHDPHGVFARLGIQVQPVRTARGNPALAFTGNTYAHNRIFQALKNDRTVWGDSQTLGRFAWFTFEDRMPRVLAAFRGGDDPVPAAPHAQPAAPEAAPASPARPPMPSWTEPARPAVPAAPPPPLVPPPPPPAPPAPRPQGPAPSGNWANLALEDALRVQPPEPTQLPPPEVAGKLIGDQAKDVGLIMDAMKRGEEAFLLGNSTGTGKTYVAAGTLATVKPTRALVVVMNQGLVSQWTEDAANFGVEIKRGDTNFSTGPGIYGITYAGLDKLVKTQGLDAIGRFDMVIYDEPHMQIMKRGTRGKLADDVSGRGRFSLYMTATPAEEPQQMQYLSRLNLWRRFTGGEQRRWMEAHGVRFEPQRTFTGQIIEKKVFRGSARQKTEHMARLRAEIVGPGKGVFRELVVDRTIAPLTSKFHTTSGQSPFTDQVQRALGALGNLPKQSIFAAVKVNIAKRLLDYEKLDAAADMAIEAIQKGQRLAVFVSNVAPFRFEDPEEGDEPDPEMRQSRVREAVVNAFRQAGLRGELPSPVEYMVNKLRARLGDDKAVYAYTGEVTDTKRKKIKTSFQKGDLKAIVATIAAGGTGLSLHDTLGVAPRTQINVGLPWTGRDLSQLLGRTYRVGVRSPVHHTFVLTPDRREQKVAQRVAGKMQTMGAFVHGIESDTNTETLAHFALVGGLPEDDDEMHQIRRSARPGPAIIALRKSVPWQEPLSVQGIGTGLATPATGAPLLVLRRYTIHTDEGDIPVELTFNPVPWKPDDQPGIGLRVSPTASG